MHNLNAKIIQIINTKSRVFKSTICIILDVLFCVISVVLSFYLRLGFVEYNSLNLYVVCSLSIIILIIIFKYFGLYNIIIRYSLVALDTIVLKGMVIYSIIFAAIISIYGIENTPRTIGVIQPTVLFFFLLSYRYVGLILLGKILNDQNQDRESVQSILIYGFNDQGRKFLSMFNERSKYKIEGFIDEDKALRSYSARGVKIYNYNDIKKLLLRNKISFILLAFLNIKELRGILLLNNCRNSTLNSN